MPETKGSRRAAAGAVALLGAVALGWPNGATAAAPPTSAVGAPVDAGDVVVVEANGSDRAITDGRSATIFSLRLPDDAVCPGDSALDQWRLQSFVVPAGVDVGSLTYNEIGPVGERQWALYGVDENPYAHVLLAPNAAPGSPGQIVPIAPLSFAVFPPGTVPDGTYRIGLACTYFGTTAKYWDAELEMTTDPGDEPGQLTWHVVGAVADTPSSSGGIGGPIIVVLIAGGAVVAALALVFTLRQRSGALSKEHA